MLNSTKEVWIDIDNTPHALIFFPFIEEFKSRGIKVLVTARDYGNVKDLMEKLKIEVIFIGKYGGKSKFKKIINTLKRSYQLVSFIRSNKIKPILSLNHGSRAQCIASKILNIKNLVLFDYEYTELKIIKHTAHKVFVPKFVDLNHLSNIGFKQSQIVLYEGIKENLYLWKWEPKLIKFPNVENKVIVVVRPPSFTANYYVEDNKKLFEAVMKKLIMEKDIFVVCLPRDKGQEIYLKTHYNLPKHFFIPSKALFGPDLLYTADVVISGGGTMNREAVLFGCKVYSIFKGKKGGVDRYLEQIGKIKFLTSPEELEFVPKKNKTKFLSREIFDEVFDKILKEIKS